MNFQPWNSIELGGVSVRLGPNPMQSQPSRPTPIYTLHQLQMHQSFSGECHSPGARNESSKSEHDGCLERA